MFSRLIAKLRGPSGHEWAQQIDAAAGRKNWEEASLRVRKALAAHPHDPAVLVRAASLSQKQGDHKAVIDHLRVLFRVKPDAWAARSILIHSLHSLGQYAEAIRAAGEAELLAEQRGCPPHIRAELALWHGISHLRAMRTEQAQACFLRSYDLDKRSDIPLQLATYARIMEFRWQTERQVLAPCAETSSQAERQPPDIVYFFISQSDAPHRSARGIDYFDLLRLSAKSARSVMPGIRVRLLTDLVTRVPDGLVDDVLRYELPSNRLMVARLSANARYLSNPLVRDTIFIDPAIYFLRDCRSAFRCEFDVGYTWRSDIVQSKQDLMPLYAGVLLVPAGRDKPAAAFLRECVACLEALERFPAVIEAYTDGGVARWWGDQLAPAAVLGWRQFYATILPRESDRVRIGGTVVRFLDSSLYNYAVDGRSDDELSGRYIVNFKGDRKRAMPDFARWFSERRQISKSSD